RFLELALHRFDLRLLRLVVGPQEPVAGAGDREHHHADDRGNHRRALLAPRGSLRLQLGFALLEFGFALCALLHLLLGERVGFLLCFLGGSRRIFLCLLGFEPGPLALGSSFLLRLLGGEGGVLLRLFRLEPRALAFRGGFLLSLLGLEPGLLPLGSKLGLLALGERRSFLGRFLARLLDRFLARFLLGLGALLGVHAELRFLLGLPLLELGLALLQLGSRVLPRLFRLGVRFGLALLVFLFLLRHLGFETGLVGLELDLGLGLAPGRFLLILLLLLARLDARVVERLAAQLGDLAFRQGRVDAGRELLHVELEVVRVVAVLDRAPELELDFLVGLRARGPVGARAVRCC